jgi:FeS assembly SUF system regulator
MLKISKLVDHGTLVLSQLPHKDHGYISASNVAQKINLSPSNVSKILKLMNKSQLVKSERGANGGYALNSQPEKITAAHILTALEGPIAITECLTDATNCKIEQTCSMGHGWKKINHLIQDALSTMTLKELQEKPIHFKSLTLRS